MFFLSAIVIKEVTMKLRTGFAGVVLAVLLALALLPTQTGNARTLMDTGTAYPAPAENADQATAEPTSTPTSVPTATPNECSESGGVTLVQEGDTSTFTATNTSAKEVTVRLSSYLKTIEGDWIKFEDGGGGGVVPACTNGKAGTTQMVAVMYQKCDGQVRWGDKVVAEFSGIAACDVHSPATATPTNTPVPPSATPTSTTVPPTTTPTNTVVPPTATSTQTTVPPTRTNTPTATNRPASPPTATPKPSNPSPTRTNIPPTATGIPPTRQPTAVPPKPTQTPIPRVPRTGAEDKTVFALIFGALLLGLGWLGLRARKGF